MRARENTIRAGARRGGQEPKKGRELKETICGREGPGHPRKGRVIMAEGIYSGSPIEDMEIVVGEFGVKMKLGFEKMQETIRCEGKCEVGFEEMEELIVMVRRREG